MKLKKYLVLIFAVCAQTLMYAQQAIVPLSEMVALKAFYTNHITNPDKDSLLSGWNMAQPNTNPDLYGWEGITVENGHITRIELSSKGLEGDFGDPLNFWLYSLSYLKHLNIANNGFEGRFPSFVSRFGSFSTEIEYFNISNNKFVGGVSMNNSLCLKLKTFLISGNKIDNFTVPPSLVLDTIDASHNILYGGSFYPYSIPDSVETTSLKYLDIRYNKLNFASLWMFSDPYGAPWTEIGVNENGFFIDTLWYYKSFFHDPQVTFLYDNQDPVYMRNAVRNLRLRKVPGASFRVDLPDVGQYSTRFLDLKDSLVYQWYKDSLALPADTFPYLERTSVGLTDYGRYYCEIRTRTESGRLQDLILNTESFQLVNEANLPPIITVPDNIDIRQPIRVLKGQVSESIEIDITDDEWWAFDVTHFPNHLSVENKYNLQVKDTTLTWVGLDSMQVTAYDNEGERTSLWVYYEVYDLLYTAPLVSVNSPDSGKINIQLDTAFYVVKVEKPTDYYALLWVDEQSMGENYVKTDSVFFTGASGVFSVDLPQKDRDYFLNIAVHSKNNTQESEYPSSIIFVVPTKPDSLFNAVGNAASVHLQWAPKGSEISMTMSSNILYRSVDNGEFVLLAEIPAGITSYEDTDVEEGHLYQYRLAKKIYGFYDSQQGSAIEFPWLYSSTQIDFRTFASTSESKIINSIHYDESSQNVVIRTFQINVSAIEVFNTSGRLLLAQNNPDIEKNTVKLNLFSLEKGVYLVRVHGKGYSESVSFVKK